MGAKLDQPADKVKQNLESLTKVVAQGLRDSQTVELRNLGRFSLEILPERTVEAEIAGAKHKIHLEKTVNPVLTVNDELKAILGQPDSKDVGEEQFRIASVHTRKSDVGFVELVGKAIPKDILTLIPEAVARRYQIVPYAVKDNNIMVATTDPENQEAVNAVAKASGKLVKISITTREDINSILDQYSGLQAELDELIKDGDELETTTDDTAKQASENEFEEDSPAAKVVATLLKRAVREKASDIHIEPTEESVEVRFRIDGLLRKILTLPKEIRPALSSRIKILANLKIDETRLPQDGRIQILLDGSKVDYRISFLPTVTGEKIVARVLDHSGGALTLDQLGVAGRAAAQLEENITKSHGMILVTGPTGSGKSTTLYAMVSKIKNEKVNIITMEDPVEYRMPGVNQSQVNAKIDFTFANGLRSILRQDPDIVMVGEIRDQETADIAINAALTGHVVFSSLHTNDSTGAIPRLIDMDVEPFLITSSLNAVIAQRLCRRICEHCRTEADVKAEDTEQIKHEIETMPEAEKTQVSGHSQFYVGRGCGVCGNTGYKGRIGIYEIFSMTETIKQLTLKRASGSDIREAAKKEGLVTMKQDGIIKALQGLTTIEEIWRVSKD